MQPHSWTRRRISYGVRPGENSSSHDGHGGSDAPEEGRPRLGTQCVASEPDASGARPPRDPSGERRGLPRTLARVGRSSGTIPERDPPRLPRTPDSPDRSSELPAERVGVREHPEGPGFGLLGAREREDVRRTTRRAGGSKAGSTLLENGRHGELSGRRTPGPPRRDPLPRSKAARFSRGAGIVRMPVRPPAPRRDKVRWADQSEPREVGAALADPRASRSRLVLRGSRPERSCRCFLEDRSQREMENRRTAKPGPQRRRLPRLSRGPSRSIAGRGGCAAQHDPARRGHPRRRRAVLHRSRRPASSSCAFAAARCRTGCRT